jgi:hypothetical protein
MADEIKAKIVIEADTSGAEEAAAALEKLQGATGASAEGAGSLGDQLAAMEKQASSTAEVVSGLAEETKGYEEAASSGEEAVSGFNDTLGEHQQAVEDVTSAYEGLADPVENATKSIALVQDTLTKSTPMFSQAAENMSAFQDAMVNPEPFNTVQQYLGETGQSWSDFIDTVGPENASRLVSAQNYVDGISNGFAEAGKSASGFTDNIVSTQQAMDEFTQSDPWTAFNLGTQDANKNVASLMSSAAGINTLGGVGSEQYGPLTFVDSLSKESSGLGDILGGAMSDVGGFMSGISSFVMPLMAFQMVGMAVSAIGQGIYNAAAIAEGPGAHGIGTFTGSVDALGQTLQQSGQTFSESFGKQIIPTIDALNYSMSQGGSGGLGGTLGGITSFLANAGMITAGIIGAGMPGSMDMIKAGGEGLINQGAQMFGFQEPFQGPGPQAQAQIDYQQKFASLPQTVGASATNLQYLGDTAMQEATDSNYLAQQQYYSSAQQYLQKRQTSYDTSHPAPSPQQMAVNYQDKQYTAADEQAYKNYQANPPTYGQDMGSEIQRGDWGGLGQSLHDAIWGPGGGSGASGGSGSVLFGSGKGIDFGGIGQAFQNSAVGQDISQMFGGAGQTFGGIGNFFGGIGQSLFGGGQQQATPYGPVGCFPAGTSVSMADGTEKSIETLQIGERILAHDGIDEVITTVLTRIVPPPRQVHKLIFSNGSTLTLTDSHPVATPLQGWKALSVEHAKLENPDLPISPLCVGDSVLMSYGICELVSIEPKAVVQIYNITVGRPHTFYANHVLVHNKGESMTATGTGTESVSLSHTFTASVTWEANNLNKQFTAAAQWAAQNLIKAVTAVANWAEQGVQHAVTAVANWAEQGVQHAVTAVANWAEQNVVHPVVAAAQWAEQNVVHPVVAAAQWAEQNVTHAVTAAAKWAESNVEHDAVAVAKWSGENLEHTFIATASWIMGGMAGFAEGTSSAPGGVAMIAEAGSPEVVEHNGQFSLFDKPAFVNLPAGAAVYPMQDIGTSSPRQLASGTVGDVTPITLPIIGGSSAGPQTANIHVHLDSQMLISLMGASLQQSINVGMGKRSY